MNDYGMVIVGAGEAGVRAAVEIREQGWTGKITMIGDEKWYPYERPPLSKSQLFAEEPLKPVTIADQTKFGELNIQLLSSNAAVRIDRKSHMIELTSGIQVPYERMLLATGANPRQLAMSGSGGQDMLYLRRFEDALRIREKLKPGKRTVIIGGGFIGLEVAASAITKGCQVTLLEVAPRILMRGVPQEIAVMVESLHRSAGVIFKLGIMIERIDRVGEEYTITLADGSQMTCDVIITGIGAVPETKVAKNSHLEIENGVKVNEFLVTSDPDIYAVGDCCSFPHPLYGNRRIRIEAWRNAQDQGTHVAANMLGASIAYASIPWFWSDQYEQTLQVVGLSESNDTTIFRDMGEAGKVFFHIGEDGRLVSVSGMGKVEGIAKHIRISEMIIEKQVRPNLVALADPGRRLKEFLRD
jgi:3-phenylpropionate/trans-cinnamate dioxygenase ferredoxin reductase subunit